MNCFCRLKNAACAVLFIAGTAAVRSEIMKDIIRLINAASNIVILGHISEDADSVGSCLAMQCALERLGKNAVIYYSGELEHRLEFMHPRGKYYSGETDKYDLCLCIDCGDIGRLGERKALFDAAEHTASVDHHVTNTYFAEANYVVADACAAGEILYDVICGLGAVVDREIAEYLFIAIASDSGSFKYSNVSPNTMRIAAKLLETGIDNAYLSRMLFDTETEKAMHFKGYTMSRVKTYCGGAISMIAVTKNELEKFGINERDTGDMVNTARMIEGAEIAVSVREAEDKIKLSFRSNGKYDVGALAQQFGGGGHKMASGAAVSGVGFEKFCSEVIKKCEEMLDG